MQSRFIVNIFHFMKENKLFRKNACLRQLIIYSSKKLVFILSQQNCMNLFFHFKNQLYFYDTSQNLFKEILSFIFKWEKMFF